MLSIKNINYNYKGKRILNNISFSLFPGSYILLKGPNGSGKTTLLKSIAGLLLPSTGETSWNNINIHDDLITYHKYCVSYLGTKHAIKEELTVLDNLKFWASIKKVPELILPAMTHFKLIEVANIPCYKLSSGWKQRVALAKLILYNTKMWLLDEPETHLDDQAKDMLQKLISIKIRDGGIVIVASHNIYNAPNECILNIQDFTTARDDNV